MILAMIFNDFVQGAKMYVLHNLGLFFLAISTEKKLIFYVYTQKRRDIVPP